MIRELGCSSVLGTRDLGGGRGRVNAFSLGEDSKKIYMLLPSISNLGPSVYLPTSSHCLISEKCDAPRNALYILHTFT